MTYKESRHDRTGKTERQDVEARGARLTRRASHGQARRGNPRRTVSDFVVAAAQEAAQRTIESAQIIRLTLEGQQQFAEAILNAPSPGARLKKTAARYRQLIREVR